MDFKAVCDAVLGSWNGTGETITDIKEIRLITRPTDVIDRLPAVWSKFVGSFLNPWHLLNLGELGRNPKRYRFEFLVTFEHTSRCLYNGD